MKIAFTAQGETWESAMDPRFGRAQYLLVFDEDADSLMAHDNSVVAAEAHGAGPRMASVLLQTGAKVLVTGNGPGGNAGRALEGKVKVYAGAGSGSVAEALKKYRDGDLALFDLD